MRRPCLRFKGTPNEYTYLHNAIKKQLPEPEECYICKGFSERFELANLSQKYSSNLDDWAYMCGSCHKRWDSDKYHWVENNWHKLCVKCVLIKAIPDFYRRKTMQISRGHVYPQSETTSWCIDCTKEWGRRPRKPKNSL